jgi:hypothetical protein
MLSSFFLTIASCHQSSLFFPSLSLCISTEGLVLAYMQVLDNALSTC